MDRRRDGAERLGEDDVRASVEYADGLRVALDGHPGHGAFGAHLDDHDPHPLSEIADASATEEPLGVVAEDRRGIEGRLGR